MFNEREMFTVSLNGGGVFFIAITIMFMGICNKNEKILQV